MKKLTKSLTILIFFLLLFLGTPASEEAYTLKTDMLIISSDTPVLVSNSTPTVVECSSFSLPLTLENVIAVIKQHDIKHPEIVLRQVQWETGHLKSKRATIDNNLFGFKAKEYKTFETWEESVEYYKKWQDKKYKGGNYYNFLERVGYAKDAYYIQNLKSIKHTESIKSLLNK